MPRTFPNDKKDRLNKIWKDLLGIQVSLFAPTEFRILKSLGYFDKIISPILDMGCGNGIYAETLMKEIPSGQIVAVDSNETLLEEFRTRIKNKPYRSNIEIFKWTAGNDKANEIRMPNGYYQVNVPALRIRSH